MKQIIAPMGGAAKNLKFTKRRENLQVLNERENKEIGTDYSFFDQGDSSRSIENVTAGLNTVHSLREGMRNISPDLSLNGPSMADSIQHFVQNFNQDQAQHGDLSQTFQASRQYVNALPPVLLKQNKPHPNHAFFSGTSRGLSTFKKTKDDPVKTLLQKIRREHKNLNSVNKEKKFELEQLVKQRLGDDLSHLPFMQKKNSLNIQYSKSPRSLYMLHQENSVGKLGKHPSKFSFGKKSSAVLPDIDQPQKKMEADYAARFQRLNIDTDIEFEELNLSRRESKAPPNYFSPKRHISKTPVNIRNSIPGVNTYEVGQNRARSDTPNKMENGLTQGIQGKRKTLKIYIYDGQSSTERMKKEGVVDSPQNKDLKLNSHYASIQVEGAAERRVESIEIKNFQSEEKGAQEVERKQSLKKTITSKISRKNSKSPQLQFFDNFDSQSAQIQRELELSGILGHYYSHDQQEEGAQSIIVQNYHGISKKKKNMGPLLRKGRSGSSRPSQNKQKIVLGYQSERPINRVIYSERKVEGSYEEALISDDEVAPSPGLMESRFSPKKKKRRVK